ncbi:unnamed protein product, partial [Ectocarpus sp. 8 AP-2014]
MGVTATGVCSQEKESRPARSRQRRARSNAGKIPWTWPPPPPPPQGGRGPAGGRGSGPTPYGVDGQARSPHGSSVGHHYLPASANSHNSFAQRPPSPSRSGSGSVSSSSGAVHSPKPSRDARTGRHNYRHVHHRG